jgi:DNA-binding NarL/FixJ family response regulator
VSTRVLVADDQALVRAGLRMIIDAQPDMEVAAEAEDGAAAIEAVATRHPDVALMDINMPRLDGLDATRRISADPALSRTRILVLTTFDADANVYEALKAGAAGFLLKDAPPETLADAVRQIAAGDALLAPSVLRRLIADYVSRPSPADGVPPGLEELTERELEVLRLIGCGLNNAEIGARLFLAEGTVKTHVGRVLLKLGLRDRVQAVITAYRSGLVTATDEL